MRLYDKICSFRNRKVSLNWPIITFWSIQSINCWGKFTMATSINRCLIRWPPCSVWANVEGSPVLVAIHEPSCMNWRRGFWCFVLFFNYWIFFVKCAFWCSLECDCLNSDCIAKVIFVLFIFKMYLIWIFLILFLFCD